MDATKVPFNTFVNAAADIYLSGMRAILVDGPPGCGKTASAKTIQEKLGLKHLFMIKPGHHDPIDFQGIPVPNHETKLTHFYASGDLLPKHDLKGGVLMVLDETADCTTPIQNLLCQMVFEGGLHSYTFPERTFFLLTANRAADRSGANRIITKLGNRVAWFTLDPTKEELINHGMRNGWNATVMAFLRERGDDPINPTDREKNGLKRATYFNSFDPQDPQQLTKPVFASSRSWEYVSNLFNSIDKPGRGAISDPDLLVRTAALIGTPVASTVVPYRSEIQHMPDPEAILRGEKVPMPKKQTILWALTISLVSRVQKDNWKHMDAWMKQVPAEYRVLAVRLAFDTRLQSLIGPDFNNTLQEADMKQAITGR